MSKRRDDSVRWDDCVVGNFCTIFDDREFSLDIGMNGGKVRLQRVRRTITQFFPISTWLPIVAASTTVLAPM